MALQRKPFVPPNAMVQGQEAVPGQPPLGAQAGRTGPLMPSPMGGNPAMENAAPAPAPGTMMGGGPLAPQNIGQMLHAKVGGVGAAPTAGGAGTPAGVQAPPTAAPLPPWGDSGTRPAAPSAAPAAPARVPFNAGLDASHDAGGPGIEQGAAQPMNPAMMLRLLRTMGRV